jgi:hypothetical protein
VFVSLTNTDNGLTNVSKFRAVETKKPLASEMIATFRLWSALAVVTVLVSVVYLIASPLLEADCETKSNP